MHLKDVKFVFARLPGVTVKGVLWPVKIYYSNNQMYCYSDDAWYV